MYWCYLQHIINWIYQKSGKYKLNISEKREVDVLINNAGVMCCPKTLTEEGFEWQFGVNYLGTFHLLF